METKERIVRSALELFLERGFDGTSLDDIAAVVGITKPAIYYHFESKNALFHEVVSFFFDEMGKWSVARFGGCETLEQLLRALLGSIESFKEVAEILLGKKRSETPYSFLELFLTASKRDPSIRERIEGGFVTTRRAIADELRKAQERGEIRDDFDCDVFAFQLHAVIEGTGLISYLDKSVDPGAMGAQMFDNIWTLLKKEAH